MSITEQTLIVCEEGKVVLQIPFPAGPRIRVIVLEATDQREQKLMALAALQS
jgi:hypothetical protein